MSVRSHSEPQGLNANKRVQTDFLRWLLHGVPWPTGAADALETLALQGESEFWWGVNCQGAFYSEADLACPRRNTQSQYRLIYLGPPFDRDASSDGLFAEHDDTGRTTRCLVSRVGSLRQYASVVGPDIPI